MEERLHKVLARAGVASRRAAERMIAEGRVRLNGRPVTELGAHINPDKDEVFVDGKRVRVASEGDQEKVYLLVNKPAGTLTTTKDDRGRKTVLDLVGGAADTRIFPVGRLDYDAEGAILLTNDGALAHQLMHPKFHVPKTYMAKVKGRPKEADLDRLRRGIYLEDGPTRAAHVEIIEEVKKNTWVEITITEGRNRLVKRMFWRIRNPVLKLLRVRFGNLTTDGLKPGAYRMLTKKELQTLKALVH